MTDTGDRRPRAPRVSRSVRRGLILDAAEGLLAEHDPLLVTFDEVARSAGVARSLVHTHLGDRRGLIDAVQTGVVERLDRWVAHGLDRADDERAACRALVFGTWSFVESEERGWSVLLSTGGLDHPAAHSLRARWVDTLVRDRPERHLTATLAVGGLLLGVGTWIRRGADVGDVHRAVQEAVLGPG